MDKIGRIKWWPMLILLASFAPLPELFVSRKGAKLAKRQWELFVLVCGFAALLKSHLTWLEK